jgi:hypothetical protein
MARTTRLTPAAPNVAYVRPELQAVLPLYKKVDDVIAGAEMVKKRKTVYLPDPSPPGTDDNGNRYSAYVTRAVFYAVTRRTLSGFLGEIFDKDPVIIVPPSMVPLIEDTNGEGVGIVQLAKKVTGLTLGHGRAGLFVDFPQTTGAVTRADLEDNTRPVIKHYHPSKIINWRYRKVGAVSKLSLVVLEEEYDSEDDGFAVKKSVQWRILMLSPEGIYRVQIARKTAANGAGFNVGEVVTPTDASGAPFKEIPFKFIGAETNDAEIDYPPLYDMADLNIAHYRNSADHEETLFISSQPTVIVSGLTEQWAEKFFKTGIGLGSRAAVPLPVGGDAKLLEVKAESAHLAEMEHKERQMVALGAKLVEQKSVQRTATEAATETASEKSTLVSVADNVSNAFEWALYFAAQFIGIKDDNIQFELNKQYSISFSTPEARKEAIEAWIAEAISFTEMRTALRKGGTAVLDDKAARKEIMDDAELMADRTQADAEDNPDNPDGNADDTGNPSGGGDGTESVDE